MKAIIAVNNLFYIGLNNKILWHSKEDFIHFKEKTLNQKLLVGYNTFTNLPPLKNREVILDERNKFITNGIDWCIGGKKTYEKYAHLFTELHISHIDNNSIGDIMFPDLKSLKSDCKIFNYYFSETKL
jgi:dihydrofolate reductase